MDAVGNVSWEVLEAAEAAEEHPPDVEPSDVESDDLPPAGAVVEGVVEEQPEVELDDLPPMPSGAALFQEWTILP